MLGPVLRSHFVRPRDGRCIVVQTRGGHVSQSHHIIAVRDWVLCCSCNPPKSRSRPHQTACSTPVIVQLASHFRSASPLLHNPGYSRLIQHLDASSDQRSRFRDHQNAESMLQVAFSFLRIMTNHCSNLCQVRSLLRLCAFCLRFSIPL